MGSLRQTTTAAVAASFAVGVALTLASGELKADRDVGLELLRSNESLAERVAAQQIELDLLRARLDSAASKPTSPGTTAPTEAPKTQTQTAVEEAAAFRKKVLVAIKPELDGIDGTFAAAKTKLDTHVEAYKQHRHEYEIITHGWVRLDSVLTGEGQALLRPTYADDWFATIRTENGQLPSGDGKLAKTTTKPK